jgi:hypothetical protein
LCLRRVCRLEKFSSIDFLRNFDGKIEVFHVPLIIFFWKKISLSFLEKNNLVSGAKIFFLNIFRCKCDEKFWRKNTHSLFCNNFDFNKHFFLFSFGGPNMFSSLFFFSDMCKARGLSNEKNYYTFFPSSHF